jgi:hypothetical protein
MGYRSGLCQMNPIDRREDPPRFDVLAFIRIVHEGLKRVFEQVQTDNFTFVVNGKRLETSLAEAILISPSISELLRSDISTRTFSIVGSDLDFDFFCRFVEFLGCRTSTLSISSP